MGALDPLKDLYYKGEDKYYQFLDKIPAMYKIVDPIDKVVPSFALFLVLGVLILILLGSLILGGLPALGPAQANLTIVAVDEDGAQLPNVNLLVEYGAEVVSSQTDELGAAEFVGIPLDADVYVTATKEGYDSRSTSFIISQSPTQSETITLEEEEEEALTRTIRLLAEDGSTITDAVWLTFDCENPYADDPPADYAYGGEYTVTLPGTCERLTVSGSVSGGSYKDIIGVLVDRDYKSIYFSADVTAKGSVVASVFSGTTPLDGIMVELYLYNEVAANPDVGPVSQSSSYNGQAQFSNVAPGYYIVKTYDPNGIYGPVQSNMVSVAPEQEALVELSLEERVIGNVMIKVVDSSTKAGIEGAEVTLMYSADKSIVTKLTTKEYENYTADFALSKDVEYLASVVADGYGISKANVRISDAVITMELEPCTPATCGIMRVQVLDQDGEAVENARVVLYSSATNFLSGYSEEISDLNGVAEFPGVSSGTYYAFAYKDVSSGRSDGKYFSPTAGESLSPNLTVTMEIPDGTIEARVMDKDERPISFAIVSIYDAFNEELIGSDFTDGNGVYSLDTKADKSVYLVVTKEDYADYVTAKKRVVPLGKAGFDVMLEPPIIDRDIEVRFMGFYSGEQGAKNTVAAGREYTAKFKMRVPEEKDYEQIGLHVRTGDQIIMEKDGIYIMSVNVPSASIIKAAKYDSDSGLSAQEYRFTESDAKWANVYWTAETSIAPGIYEAEAVVKIKETAKVGDELNLYYRAWAENSGKERDPADDRLEVIDLYANAYKQTYQVGISTLCDKDFCFSASIKDLDEGLIDSVSDSYDAKIFQDYVLTYTITNNSKTKIHDNADLRMRNEDEAILFSSYMIIDAESQPFGDSLGENNDPLVPGHEITRHTIGNLSPGKSAKVTLDFKTLKSMAGVVNLQIVSDYRVVFEKNITINIAAPKELSVSVTPAKYPSGIPIDLEVLVKDAASNLEIDDAVVKLLDRHKNILVTSLTDKTGIAKITMPAQKPGEEITVVVEKPEYNRVEKVLKIDPNVIKLTPEQIGLTLNAKTKHEDSKTMQAKNMTSFPLKVTSIKLVGGFENLLDEAKMQSWLEGAYNNLTLRAGEEVGMDIRAFISDDGKLIEETTTLQGTLEIGVSNFGETWYFTAPVTVTIGVGAEVDDAGCLTITKAKWVAATEGNPVLAEFDIQNNCTVAGNPVSLKNLEAKVDLQASNEIGDYFISIGEDSRLLRSGYFKMLKQVMAPDERYSAVLTFSPYAQVSGVSTANIVIQASNALEGPDQILRTTMATEITAVNLKDCISFSKELIDIDPEGEASFKISTKGCGDKVDFTFESDLDLSLKELTLGAEEESPEITVSARGRIPGQYGIKVLAKGANLKQEGEFRLVRARVWSAGCIQLSRYEFDVYKNPLDRYSGYDTAELVNTCYEQQVTTKVKAEPDLMRSLGTASSMFIGGALINLASGKDADKVGECDWDEKWDGTKKKCVKIPEAGREETCVESKYFGRDNCNKKMGLECHDTRNVCVCPDGKEWDDQDKECKTTKSEDRLVSVATTTPADISPLAGFASLFAIPTALANQGGLDLQGVTNQLNRTVGIVDKLGKVALGGGNPLATGGVWGLTGFLYGQNKTTEFTVQSVQDRVVIEGEGGSLSAEDEENPLLFAAQRPGEDVAIENDPYSVRWIRDRGEEIQAIEKKFVPDPNNPALRYAKMQIAIENNEENPTITGIYNPDYRIIRISAEEHRYVDRTHDLGDLVDMGEDLDRFLEGMRFDYDFPTVDIERDDPRLAQELPTDATQRFRIELNAINPSDLNYISPGPLLNCQWGTRQGTTGAENRPMVNYVWNWGAVGALSNGLGRCDVESNDPFYCDGTQFATEVMNKLNYVDTTLSGMGLDECPSPFSAVSSVENTIGVSDVGLSRLNIDKTSDVDVNVLVDITNTNPGGAVLVDVQLTISEDDGSNAQICSIDDTEVPAGSLTIGTSVQIGCEFENLADGEYRVTAIIPDAGITIPAACKECEYITASNAISTSFSIGQTGLEECEPYSTTRLRDFLAANNIDASTVQGLTNAVSFQAYLIKDRYSKDFQGDFDQYAVSESLFNAPSWYTNARTGLTKYMTDYERMRFAPLYGEANPEGYMLPGPGIYNVTLDIEYEDASWQLFNGDNPNAVVRVRLDKADTPNPDSPLYYIPFDGRIGLSSGRTGYGANYSGSNVPVQSGSNVVRTVEIAGSTPVTTVNVSSYDDFKRLNVLDRGVVLSIKDKDNPKIVFSPSSATPVMMRIENERDEAWGFYSVGISGDSDAEGGLGGSAINTGPWMSEWSGVGMACRDFDDRIAADSFDWKKDQHAIDTECAVIPMDYKATAYGFEFCEPSKAGDLYLKSIMFTPANKTATMSVVHGNDEIRLFNGNIWNTQNVPLGGASGQFGSSMDSLNAIIEMMDDELICMSTSTGSTEFWWNPKTVYGTGNFANEVSSIEQDCEQ